MVKNLPANAGDIRDIGPIPGMATHSSLLAWRIPWTEEPGGLQSIRSQRINLTTFKLLADLYLHPVFCKKEIILDFVKNDTYP